MCREKSVCTYSSYSTKSSPKYNSLLVFFSFVQLCKDKALAQQLCCFSFNAIALMFSNLSTVIRLKMALMSNELMQCEGQSCKVNLINRTCIVKNAMWFHTTRHFFSLLSCLLVFLLVVHCVGF